MTIKATPKTFVSYLRVSSRAQGDSGLGIEAQRADVARHVAASGGVVIAEYVEVESGKRSDRPKLAEALALVRASKATLVVAKMDRLARNVAFLSALMEAGVEFLAVDNPHATRLTVHILAAVAEFEREMIVKRTTAALAQAKLRGVRLGSRREGHWHGREERRRRGAAVGSQKAALRHRELADAAAGDIAPIILRLRADGLSLSGVARALNARDIPTRRGRCWTSTGVGNVLRRIGQPLERGA